MAGTARGGRSISESFARDLFAAIRWPDGVRCPRCQDQRVSSLRARRQFECSSCSYQFSLYSGTLLHGSKLTPRQWVTALLVVLEEGGSLTSRTLAGRARVSYRTAWRIRALLRSLPARHRELLGRGIDDHDHWLAPIQELLAHLLRVPDRSDPPSASGECGGERGLACGGNGGTTE